MNKAWLVVGPDAPESQAQKIYLERLRDEFAMAALTGLLANSSHDDLEPSAWGHDAYTIADAMMEARRK
jgi:hypothetical protein